ncbi:MAG: tyrosine--tRNA ligase [Candidatus Omnitrophica bacterium]|nr:tyrosine--tRNA ligase [Candidatus Omnitrophota bacterium]
MPRHLDIEEEVRVFEAGAAELISRDEIKKKLLDARKTGRPLKLKYGADPSAPDIHLGHTVPLRKLRSLQDLGHQVIFIIGDFTARIGDPSQQSETRKMLSAEQVRANAESYQKQVFKVLDPARTTVRYNSEWLDRMSPNDFLALTSKYTVARLLERDDFKKRFDSKQPIALLEFLYPLLQGHDSVVLQADVEIGGTDQKFNLLVGRELQRDAGQEPQAVLTLPILEGTDGVQKMSKSLGNYIAVQDPPNDMFGKVMSIPDALMGRYFTYLTDLPAAEVAELEKGLRDGRVHPRDLKVRLAKEIVALYHSPQQAEAAQREFDNVFREGGLPEDMPEVAIPAAKLKDGAIDILNLLQEAGLTVSKSEGRRLIQQGGVRVNQNKVTSDQEQVRLSDPTVIQCGKRKFARVRAERP